MRRLILTIVAGGIGILMILLGIVEHVRFVNDKSDRENAWMLIVAGSILINVTNIVLIITQ